MCLLVYLLLIHRLGERELWSSHEARAAQDAQYLLDGGDWRLPRLLDGRPELQKPPLYYWLTALFGWCRGGVDEAAVRLPAACGAILTALALFVFLRHHGRPRSGVLAAVLLLTMVHFTWLGRVGRIDMPLTAVTSWCVVSFLIGGSKENGRFAWLLLGYVSLTAGLMLKGPIAVVLAGVVVLPSALVTARPSEENARPSIYTLIRSLLWGLPLVAALVLPWCCWVNEATQGGFVQEFVIKHNLQRGLGGDEQLDAHVHPGWFYFARLWFDTAPWSVLLPAALWWFWRERQRQPLAVVGLTWFTAVLVCMSLFQYKRADYLLPAYPGLALFLGVAADHWLTLARPSVRTGVWRTGLATTGAVALGWCGYTTWVLPAQEPRRALGPFARVVRDYLPRPGQVILFRVDSHHLNWELGKTVERIWEWENLGWWATRPAPVYVVMPQKFAEECAAQLPEGRLFPLANTGEHETPLVLFVNAAGQALAAHSPLP